MTISGPFWPRIRTRLTSHLSTSFDSFHSWCFIPSKSSVDGGRFKVHSFTYEKKVSVPETEEEAKEHVVVLFRGYLECDFEVLPEYDFFGSY
jgi:hypothetical protein